jgi:predicted metal-dependent phosphoesterase TrpH
MEVTVRGVLHCHSNYSYDGKLSLLEIKSLCLENGVQFVCMTEHTDELTQEQAKTFVDECKRLSDDSFVFIPGFEVPYGRAHVLMIGATEFLGTYAPDIPALKQWTVRAPFTILAHPVRNRFDVSDELLEEINGLEVWNQQYEGKRVPRTRSLKLYEVLRKKKQTLVATGGIDFHRKEHFGAPLITLNISEFTETAIIEKMKGGAFMVSSNQGHFYGTLPNARELQKAHQCESALTVVIIVVGKLTNKILKSLGLSLPRSLKERIRRQV